MRPEPVCTCGHLAGDHRRAGHWLHGFRYGVCEMPKCDCREYQPVEPTDDA